MPGRPVKGRRLHQRGGTPCVPGSRQPPVVSRTTRVVRQRPSKRTRDLRAASAANQLRLVARSAELAEPMSC